MLQGSSFYGHWDYWNQYNNPDPNQNWKVVFDGVTKTIWILEGLTNIDVRIDLYSNWKEWVQLSGNSRFEQAFLIEGGIPISDTEFTGVTYFLVNNWTIRQQNATTPVIIDGNLYGYVDEGATPKYPYGTDPAGLISINSKVSNLVDLITTTETETVPALSDEQAWILKMAYEEARRSRAMQTNKVNITTIGDGDSAVDTINVYDDDGTTLLYTITVTGEDADNRDISYSKPYCPETTPPTPCE